MTDAQFTSRPTMLEAGLDLWRYGYFTRPIPRDNERVRNAPEATRWFELEDLIARLTRGDFSVVPAILESSRQSRDWRLKTVAIGVLGHAGTVECLRDMRSELEQHPARKHEAIDVETRELVLVYCGAFASWGRLDVVPVLMDQYLTLRLKRTPEISVLPLLMAELVVGDMGSMIAHEPPEEHLEDYLNLVMNQYDSVVQALGSDKAFVFRGALQSVRGLAELMRHVKARTVSVELFRLRRRFEPATGIDCSAIFEGDEVHPLAAAALAEDFLDSPAAARFEDGVRYFFGHRIPD